MHARQMAPSNDRGRSSSTRGFMRQRPRSSPAALWPQEAAYFLLSWASSSLHEGAQTAWALPSTFLVPIMERGLCLPHKKQDMVALPKEVVATKGEPETLDL